MSERVGAAASGPERSGGKTSPVSAARASESSAQSERVGAAASGPERSGGKTSPVSAARASESSAQRERVGAAASGPERIDAFTVLYDGGCPICRTAHRWLAARDQLVPLGFVPAGSPEARRLFPGLGHDATLRDLTVIADNGLVYVSDGAWLACLWALTDYRGMAERLSSPRLLPAARRFIAAAAAVRETTIASSTRATGGTRTGDYGDVCDDRCRSA